MPGKGRCFGFALPERERELGNESDSLQHVTSALLQT
jgi:hypothetical protein